MDHRLSKAMLLKAWESFCSGHNGSVDAAEEPLFTCVRLKKRKVLAKLLSVGGLNPNGRERNPLCAAAYDGHLESAELLVAAGAELEVHSATDPMNIRPLHIAASRGHAHITQFLLSQGADHKHCVNGLNPLEAAIVGDHVACVKAFVDSGRPIGEWTVLLVGACQLGHVKCLRILLRAGACSAVEMDGTSPIEAGDTRRSPLHVAAGEGHGKCTAGHVECIAALIAYGAPLDAMYSIHYMTPLMFAAGNVDASSLILLLESGADMEVKDIAGRTAVAYAAYRSPASLREIIARGAQVDDPRLLLYAAACRAPRAAESVALLLESGLRVDSTVQGVSPLHMAVACRNTHTIAALLAASALVG